MICSLKPLSVQHFVKNFHLAFKIQCNMITCGLRFSFMLQCEKGSICPVCFVLFSVLVEFRRLVSG